MHGGPLPGLDDLAVAFDRHDLELTGLVSSSVQDWDHYESEHWANVWTWARATPDHPRRAEMLSLSRGFREQYLHELRGRIGWSVLVGHR